MMVAGVKLTWFFIFIFRATIKKLVLVFIWIELFKELHLSCNNVFFICRHEKPIFQLKISLRVTYRSYCMSFHRHMNYSCMISHTAHCSKFICIIFERFRLFQTFRYGGLLFSHFHLKNGVLL